jgi:hypothetical protein
VGAFGVLGTTGTLSRLQHAVRVHLALKPGDTATVSGLGSGATVAFLRPTGVGGDSCGQRTASGGSHGENHHTTVMQAARNRQPATIPAALHRYSAIGVLRGSDGGRPTGRGGIRRPPAVGFGAQLRDVDTESVSERLDSVRPRRLVVALFDRGDCLLRYPSSDGELALRESSFLA